MTDEIRADQTLKHQLKIVRWKVRRAGAALRWGSKKLAASPAVLGNAMPKSGSHLIIQVLQGLTRIGPFVNPGFPPVNRSEDNLKLAERAILDNIDAMLPGDIAYGYIHARQPFVQALTNPGRATVFVYRDPRDMIVSHVFYATEMHSEHGMHRYYTQSLHSMEERLQAAIQGIDRVDLKLSNVEERYKPYLGWLEIPQALCLRFEDLILDRETAFVRLLVYLEDRGMLMDVAKEQAVQTLKDAIAPRKSGTFRRGQPGNWREYFTEANKKQFKETAGDLLIQMGYERDFDW